MIHLLFGISFVRFNVSSSRYLIELLLILASVVSSRRYLDSDDHESDGAYWAVYDATASCYVTDGTKVDDSC